MIDVRITRKAKPRELRPCEAYPAITPEGVRYRCERQPWDPKCSRFDLCPIFKTYVGEPVNEQRFPVPIYERYAPFPYGSREWKRLYNKRVSVERAFSRLKGYRKVNDVRTRGLAKVWLHVALSLLAMLAARLGKPYVRPWPETALAA